MTLSQEIFQAGADFSRISEAPVQIEKENLPTSVTSYLSRWHAPLRKSDGTFYLNSSLGEAPSSEVRKWGFRTYHAEKPEQEKLIKRLVSARQELAQLVGYRSFFERAQQFHLLDSTRQVEKFLLGMADAIRPSVGKELRILETVHAESESEPLQCWDIHYATSLLRNSLYQIVRKDFEPYFSLGNLMEGLSSFFQTLYGVRLEWQTPANGELWEPSVQKLASRLF